MEIVLFNVLCFGIEFLKITFLLLFLYGTGFAPLKKYLIIASVSFAAVGEISFFVNLNDVLFGYTAILLVSFAVIMNDKRSILFIFIMYMYICIIDMSINGLLMYVFDLTIEEIGGDRLLYVALNLPSLLIFIPITIAKLVLHKNIFNDLVNEQKLLLIISGAAITFYTTSIQVFAFSDMNKKYLRLTSIALSLGSVILIFILAKLNKSRIDIKHLKNENYLVNRILHNHEEYYLKLLEKENDTKAFRHDMKYHVMCMSKLYNENKTEEFEQYLRQFTDTFEDLRMNYDTGSSLINAILNDLSAKYSDVTLKCSGHFYDNMDISSFDLCTIFFNILKNAFEAAEKTEEKKIEFIISYSGASLFIKLKNSALRQPVKKKGRYISDKEEEGHGYGLQNVCGCVERLGGEFGISYSEGEVVVDIIFFCALPVKDEKDTYRLDAESDQLPC